MTLLLNAHASSNSLQGASGSSRQCQVRSSAYHPTLGKCDFEHCTKRFQKGLGSNNNRRKSLADYFPRSYSDGYSKSNSKLSKNGESIAPKLKYSSDGSSVKERGIHNRTSEHAREAASVSSQHCVRPYPKEVFFKNNALNEARVREHRSTGEVRLEKTEPSVEVQEEYQEGEVEEGFQRPDSILNQGRKYYDHLPGGFLRCKKHDDNGAKTPWVRDSRPYLVCLKANDWQTIEREDISDPIDTRTTTESSTAEDTVEVEGGMEAFGKNESVSHGWSKPYKASVDGLNKAFGQHLRDLTYRSSHYQNCSNISNDKNYRRLDVENARFLKAEIEEALQEHRLQSDQQADLQNTFKFDFEYETALKAEYDKYVNEITDQYYHDLEQYKKCEKEIAEQEQRDIAEWDRIEAELYK